MYTRALSTVLHLVFWVLICEFVSIFILFALVIRYSHDFVCPADGRRRRCFSYANSTCRARFEFRFLTDWPNIPPVPNLYVTLSLYRTLTLLSLSRFFLYYLNNSLTNWGGRQLRYLSIPLLTVPRQYEAHLLLAADVMRRNPITLSGCSITARSLSY